VEVLRQIEQRGAIAPSLWPLEVQNALLMAERRKRLNQQKRHQLLGLIQALPVTLDTETAAQSWTHTMQLAERFRLTSYDATYLELAQRRNLPLATLHLMSEEFFNRFINTLYCMSIFCLTKRYTAV
jgi:predicted nucleic acid-binding protein